MLTYYKYHHIYTNRVTPNLVEVRDETRQLVLQVGRRGEAATSNDFAHDHAKHALNLVQPRRVLGQVHEANAMVPVRQKRLLRRLRLQNARSAFFPQLLVD